MGAMLLQQVHSGELWTEAYSTQQLDLDDAQWRPGMYDQLAVPPKRRPGDSLMVKASSPCLWILDSLTLALDHSRRAFVAENRVSARATR